MNIDHQGSHRDSEFPYREILWAKRVLVVEPVFVVAREIADEITEIGATVVGPFHSEREAGQSLGVGEDPDLALIELSSLLGPGNDALELTRELERRSIPYVAYSAYEQSMLPGAIAEAPYLPKPSKSDAMLRLLAYSAVIGQPCPGA